MKEAIRPVFVGPLIGDAPKGWVLVHRFGDGFAYHQAAGGLRVLIDCAEKTDGKKWLHVSVSRKSWTPSHDDMALVKDAFIGPDHYAYSVWVPSSMHVNIHSHCLHLWVMVESEDGRVLPEFSEVLEAVGRSI